MLFQEQNNFYAMKKEFKLGLFVVCVIVVSFFVLNYLRGKDIFNKEIQLKARYEKVEGLIPSAPVYIKGFKAGKVDEVTYDPLTEDFLVVCSVSRQFNIPSDSRMLIYSVDIMGGKGVRIDIGSSDSSAFDGDTLTSGFEAGLMDGLSAGVGPLLEKLTGALDSLSVTLSGANRLLSDSNQKSVSSALENLDASMANLRTLSRSVSGKSTEISELIENLQAFSGELCEISQLADTTLSSVNKVIDNISEADIQKVVTSLGTILDNINNPEGTVGTLLVDNSLYNSVDSLVNDINSLIELISENPKKYLKISVF